jgi:hypothetical protein
MLGSKICCLLVVSALTAHGNRSIKIKFEVTRRFDKFLKLINVLELGVTI